MRGGPKPFVSVSVQERCENTMSASHYTLYKSERDYDRQSSPSDADVDAGGAGVACTGLSSGVGEFMCSGLVGCGDWGGDA